MGRSKSLDKKEVEIERFDNTIDTNKANLVKYKKVAELPVLAVQHKFKSNVSEIFDRVHSKSKDRKDKETRPHVDAETLKEEKQYIKKINDSPVLALRKKFESKVSGFSLRKQSQPDKTGEKRKLEMKDRKHLCSHVIAALSLMDSFTRMWTFQRTSFPRILLLHHPKKH